MKKYRAVLFDLFGTVALFDREKLPIFEWKGQISRSTMGRLRFIVEEKAPHIPFGRCHEEAGSAARRASGPGSVTF